MEIIKTTFQLKRGFEEEWNQLSDYVLKEGEPGIVLDKNLLKIGDGITPWKYLPYLNSVGRKFANIKSLGAKGLDGKDDQGNVIDDTSIFQFAIDNYDEIYIPEGTYYIHGIKIPSNKKIIGNNAVLKLSINCDYETTWSSDTTIFSIEEQNGQVNVKNVEIDGIHFDGNGQWLINQNPKTLFIDILTDIPNIANSSIKSIATAYTGKKASDYDIGYVTEDNKYVVYEDPITKEKIFYNIETVNPLQKNMITRNLLSDCILIRSGQNIKIHHCSFDNVRDRAIGGVAGVKGSYLSEDKNRFAVNNLHVYNCDFFEGNIPYKLIKSSEYIPGGPPLAPFTENNPNGEYTGYFPRSYLRNPKEEKYYWCPVTNNAIQITQSGYLSTNSDILIENCKVHKSSNYGFMIYPSSKNCIIRNNIVLNCGMYSTEDTYGPIVPKLLFNNGGEYLGQDLTNFVQTYQFDYYYYLYFGASEGWMLKAKNNEPFICSSIKIAQLYKEYAKNKKTYAGAHDVGGCVKLQNPENAIIENNVFKNARGNFIAVHGADYDIDGKPVYIPLPKNITISNNTLEGKGEHSHYYVYNENGKRTNILLDKTFDNNALLSGYGIYIEEGSNINILNNKLLNIWGDLRNYTETCYEINSNNQMELAEGRKSGMRIYGIVVKNEALIEENEIVGSVSGIGCASNIIIQNNIIETDHENICVAPYNTLVTFEANKAEKVNYLPENVSILNNPYLMTIKTSNSNIHFDTNKKENNSITPRNIMVSNNTIKRNNNGPFIMMKYLSITRPEEANNIIENNSFFNVIKNTEISENNAIIYKEII